jgi:hypothetical protein
MKYTEAKIKKAAASRYMNEDQLDFFKDRLNQYENRIKKALRK